MFILDLSEIDQVRNDNTNIETLKKTYDKQIEHEKILTQQVPSPFTNLDYDAL